MVSLRKCTVDGTNHHPGFLSKTLITVTYEEVKIKLKCTERGVMKRKLGDRPK